MAATDRFKGVANEDGSCTLLGLVTARDATGAPAPNEEDGNLIKRVDLSAITLSVFDLDSTTPNVAVHVATLPISTVISDTLVTTGVYAALDNGGNFLYDVAPGVMIEGNHIYEFEVKFTTTGGAVAWGLWTIRTQTIRTS